MTRSKGTPELFNRSLPWKLPFMWMGDSGIVKLDADRVAKVTLSTRAGIRDGIPTVGRYVGYEASIVSKRSGHIDSCEFPFNELWDPTDMRVRADARSDYSGPFCVVSHCGWTWYIAVPRFADVLTSAVERYIEIMK